MKKTILSTLLLFVILISNSSICYSQEYSFQEVESDFIPYSVGGLNLSGITGVQDKSEVSRFPTFNVGLGFVYLINNSFGMSVEGSFSQQGAKLNGTMNDEPEFIKLNYINLPAVLRYHPKKGSDFWIGAGPQIGFIVGGHVLNVDGSQSYMKDEALNKTSFDGVASIGSYFGNAGDFGVEVRYQHGLNKFFNYAPEFRHSILQVRLIFPLFFLEMLADSYSNI
jgi:hypothetical protein